MLIYNEYFIEANSKKDEKEIIRTRSQYANIRKMIEKKKEKYNKIKEEMPYKEQEFIHNLLMTLGFFGMIGSMSYIGFYKNSFIYAKRTRFNF